MDQDEEDDSEEEDEEDEVASATKKRAMKRKAEDDAEAEEDEDEEGEEDEEAEEEEAEEQEEQAPVMTGPPRILLTTSPGPTKATYQFCDELKNVFPGGEFFKRPKGRGFELGRVARWAAKRGYHACIVVNEDHKKPSEFHVAARLDPTQLTVTDAITLINLPAGPTAYFKLSSVQLSSEIYVSNKETTPANSRNMLAPLPTLPSSSSTASRRCSVTLLDACSVSSSLRFPSSVDDRSSPSTTSETSSSSAVIVTPSLLRQRPSSKRLVPASR